MALFRQEALESHGRKLFGEVVLRRAPSSWFMLSVILAMVAVALLFVAYAELTRKIIVQGYLSPKVGVATVHAVRPGTIEKLFVSDGQFVRKGQPIAAVKYSGVLVTGGAVSEEMRKDLLTSRDRLDHQAILSRTKAASQADQARQHVGASKVQLSNLRRIRSAQSRRLEIAGREIVGYERLHTRGYVSTFDMRRRESDMLAQQQSVAEIDQRISELGAEILQQEAVSRQLMVDVSITQDELDRQRADLNMRLNELSLSGGELLVAPVDGVVTNLQADIGSLVTVDGPIVTLIPAGATVEARLYVPSESIGFIEPGQPAVLLFSAFPYQNYGVGRGTVESVSKMVLSPDRVVGPLRLEVPTYRVSVKLSSNRLRGYGKDLALTPGMTLKAEIVQDRRTIAGWLLEPLRAFRGRTI